MSIKVALEHRTSTADRLVRVYPHRAAARRHSRTPSEASLHQTWLSSTGGRTLGAAGLSESYRRAYRH